MCSSRRKPSEEENDLERYGVGKRQAGVGSARQVTMMAGFSVGDWLVTFCRSGFRSDCYLSRCSSETSDGVAASVRNVRPLLSLDVESASSRLQAEI